MSLSSTKLLTNVLKNIQVLAARQCATNKVSESSEPSLPNYRIPNAHREALVESLSTTDAACGLVRLHPEVFGRFPLLHLVRRSLEWQENMRSINYVHEQTKAELPGSDKKPWQQKGLGRARQGSWRSPQFVKGGKCHGLREFTSKYRFLNTSERVLALTSMLSIKLAQDDLVVVDSLEIASPSPQALEEMTEMKNWGPAVLFSDVSDYMPANITAATDEIPHFNLMPAYGLNVWSMLKHQTLVLTVDAVRHLETKLLEAIYENDQSRDREFRKRPMYE